MLKLSQTKNEPGIDIIRILAMFFVISLHFFLYSGYYYIEDIQPDIIFHVSFRALFFQCVPLFLMITGYLKRNAVFGRKHFINTIPVLISYIIVCAVVIAWKVLYLKESWGFWIWAKSVWTFNQPSYAWYVNMYFSLIIFIPFINSAYNSLKTRRHKLIAVWLVILSTTLAATVNKINLPETGGITSIGLPLSCFSALWPAAYYVTGMYIGEYRPRYPRFMTAGLAALFCFAVGYANYATVKTNYYSGYNAENFDIVNVIISGLIFLTLYDIDIKNKYIRFILSKISKLSMITYLISYIFDNMIYIKVLSSFTGYSSYLPMYFKIVPLHFLITVVSSIPIYIIVKFISSKITDLLNKKLIK